MFDAIFSFKNGSFEAQVLSYTAFDIGLSLVGGNIRSLLAIDCVEPPFAC